MPLHESWVEGANESTSAFPLNNLPYGVFSTPGLSPRCGVAIGNQVLDIQQLESDGILKLQDALHDVGAIETSAQLSTLFTQASWNPLMAQPAAIWAAFRSRLISLLQANSDQQAVVQAYLHPLDSLQLHMPFQVCEFTDFYAGRHHATNVGTMFRGAENALPPNWLHIPIGYNGRASSVVVSGTDIRRPWGQLKSPDQQRPAFMPSRRFDLELEMGAIVGTPCSGPVSVDEADAMIFGYVLLNDWSARDIQAWEYQPLGPFQAKATGTSISPWIVTSAALEPFRTATPAREFELLPHLQDTSPMLYDIELAVHLATPDGTNTTLCNTNYNEMYYSAAQQLAHHSSSGCPMRTGDLLGSGTISGPEKSQRGSLLELSWGGKEPLTLSNGESRSFLADGDTVYLSGQAIGDGYQIGFGDCAGTVVPALTDPYQR